MEGAEPGDALVVRFSKVRMNRTWGFTAYRLGLFALTPEAITTLYPGKYDVVTIAGSMALKIPKKYLP
ncbi:MAG: hypothetical protein HY736_21485 [Verrucomicrobia bacterium]|nr:hypothetical protein [Verrucomicrobiota bacterium]